jgi:branched-chain amino acid transport system permease protein
VTQQLVNGLQLGAIYSLFAVGFTIIFGVHRILNLAQGSLLTAAGLVAYVAAQNLHTGFVITIVIAAAAGACISTLIDLLAFKPLRAVGAPEEATLVVSIGASLIIETIAQRLTSTQPESYPSAASLGWRIHLGGVLVTGLQVVTVVLCLVLSAATLYYIRFTQTGRTIRAVSCDPRTASLMGIRPQSVYLKTFALCGVITGVAAVLVGQYVSSLSYNTGDSYLLIGITAIVVGGMGSIPGAVVAGFAIGLIEAFTLQYISSTWSLAAPFILLFGMLLFRPQGLFGSFDPRSAIGRNA